MYNDGKEFCPILIRSEFEMVFQSEVKPHFNQKQCFLHIDEQML